jgi:hypothetical protein
MARIVIMRKIDFLSSWYPSLREGLDLRDRKIGQKSRLKVGHVRIKRGLQEILQFLLYGQHKALDILVGIVIGDVELIPP